jgi:class 3 adenylate cyclase
MYKSNISQKKLKAIVFTDMADFTTISAQDEQKALNLIQKQNEIIKPIVEKHNGEWLKEIGDGLLFSFDSSLEAVRCSIEIQETLKEFNDLNIRVGIHQGDIFIKDGDVFGDDVNIASRVEGFAPTGGISLSDKVHKDISGVSDIKTSFIGHRKLKGVEQETKIRCITSNELPKHRTQIFPLIIGYYSIILGGLNAFLIFALIIYSAFIGFKLHFLWMCAFIINFTVIFIGYSCLSYVRGVSIKAQRLFVYLGYFIIISTILSALAMQRGLLFYLPPPETMLPF